MTTDQVLIFLECVRHFYNIKKKTCKTVPMVSRPAVKSINQFKELSSNKSYKWGNRTEDCSRSKQSQLLIFYGHPKSGKGTVLLCVRQNSLSLVSSLCEMWEKNEPVYPWTDNSINRPETIKSYWQCIHSEINNKNSFPYKGVEIL